MAERKATGTHGARANAGRRRWGWPVGCSARLLRQTSMMRLNPTSARDETGLLTRAAGNALLA